MFKKLTIIALLSASLLACVDSNNNDNKITKHPRTDTRPNIIVIVTDDQGYADLGIQGYDNDIRTPSIDALAQQGIRMTSGYVTAPQCAPSRAALVTGKYQERLGLEDNSSTPLKLGWITLAQRLHTLGYKTGLTGKWHMEIMPDSLPWLEKHHPEINPSNFKPGQINPRERAQYQPNHRGFDQVFSGYQTGFWANYNTAGDAINEQFITINHPRIDVVSQASINFIKNHADEPFYLSVNYFAPHTPLEATPEYLNAIPLYLPQRRRYALAMMAAIDKSVGNIVTTLKQQNIYEDTLIFFVSDNGAILNETMPDEDIDIAQGWDGSLNTPLRGEKSMLTEGGIRVPFVMHWKGTLAENHVVDKPVSTLDIATTALFLAGDIHYDNLDGLNLLDYLDANNTDIRTLFWRFYSQRAARKGAWKYLSIGNGQFEFLYNLDSDKEEQVNLIDQYPDIAKALKTELAHWESTMPAPRVVGTKDEREKYLFYYGLQIQ